MRRIGPYIVEDVLANDTTGVMVYRGRRAATTTPVVVKLVRHRSTADDFKRAANELRAMHHVQSSHVVPLLDAGRHDGQLYSVTPYYAEGTLADGTADALSDLGRLCDAAKGVHDLHEHGIIHRDIRPSSIIRSADSAVIGELGLVTLLWPGMTTTGFGPLGSLEFTDPQLLLGQPAGRHSDIWGLGAVTHALATGISLYPAADRLNAAAAVLAVTRGRPQIAVGCLQPLVPVIERALAHDPAGRFRTAVEFAGALRDALAECDEEQARRSDQKEVPSDAI